VNCWTDLTSNLFPFSKFHTQSLTLVLRQKHPKILNEKNNTCICYFDFKERIIQKIKINKPAT